MEYFLVKTEPQSYSIDDLKSDKTTVWDGIRNPQALRAVRSMKPGDRVFVYHSGAQAGVTGIAEVVSESRADPKDPKLSVVDLQYVGHIEPPTSLAEIKQSKLFGDWALVRQGRLSTMAAPAEFVKWMRKRYPQAKI
ncbi:MAG: EVE domain-containing protein [Bryobacteraceae bacterium]